MFSFLRLEKIFPQRRAHFSFMGLDQVYFLALPQVKAQVLILLQLKVLDPTELCVLKVKQVAVHLGSVQYPLFMQLHYDLLDFPSIQIQEEKLREYSPV